MADKHITYAVLVAQNLTDTEKEWLEDISIYARNDGATEGVPGLDLGDDPWWDEADLDFTYDIDALYITSDHNSDLSLHTKFIQSFLTKFRPGSTVVFSWAETCSNPSTHEFGGGEYLVTADFIYSGTYCVPLAREYERRKGETPSHTLAVDAPAPQLKWLHEQ